MCVCNIKYNAILLMCVQYNINISNTIQLMTDDRPYRYSLACQPASWLASYSLAAASRLLQPKPAENDCLTDTSQLTTLLPANTVLPITAMTYSVPIQYHAIQPAGWLLQYIILNTYIQVFYSILLMQYNILM